jgi:hypothetical protein
MRDRPTTLTLLRGASARARYGLASLRWFEPRTFLFGDPDEASNASQNDEGVGKMEVEQQPLVTCESITRTFVM